MINHNEITSQMVIKHKRTQGMYITFHSVAFESHSIGSAEIHPYVPLIGNGVSTVTYFRFEEDFSGFELIYKGFNEEDVNVNGIPVKVPSSPYLALKSVKLRHKKSGLVYQLRERIAKLKINGKWEAVSILQAPDKSFIVVLTEELLGLFNEVEEAFEG